MRYVTERRPCEIILYSFISEIRNEDGIINYLFHLGVFEMHVHLINIT